LDKFVVVVPIPSFERRPNSETNPEWFKKFAFSMLRLHAVTYTVTLDELDLFTIEELVEMGNFEFDTRNPHAWIRRMWAGEVPDYQALNQLNNLGVEPDEGPEDPERDNDAFAELLVPADAEALPDLDLAAEETANFPYFEDKERFCPDWNNGTAGAFRDMVRSEPPTCVDQDALPFEDLNVKQQAVVRYVLDQYDLETQFLLEVCGSAGTGKTTIMKRIREDIKVRLDEGGILQVRDVLRFTAATGTAAQLLPSPNVTLHKMLHLPINADKDQAIQRLSSETLKRLQDELKHLRVIFIDEKSFVGCRMLYEIDARLKQIFDKQDVPFGGLSVVLVGDFKQLSPVKDYPLFTALTEKNLKTYQRFGIKVYQEFNHVIRLTEVRRQSEDPEFLATLQAFVDGSFGSDEWDTLMSRNLDSLPAEEKAQFNQDAIYLCGVKRDFRSFNLEKVHGLGTPRILISAENIPASASSLGESDAGGLPKTLLLCRGMRVLLTANVSVEHGLTNGSLGTVIGIIYVSEVDHFPSVLIQFDTYRGPSFLEDVARVYPVTAITRSWARKGKQEERTMLPLLPGFAFSIHKAQGKTLGKAIINLGGSEFASGLTYTALTRVKSLKDLAFKPMPSMERFTRIFKTKGYLAQKLDDEEKANRELNLV
jgi:hypothetical protein